MEEGILVDEDDPGESPERQRPMTMEQQIRGRYKENEAQMVQLREAWYQQECHIVGATDGGLKNMMGTSSYAAFFPGETQPIFLGYSGEYQPRLFASSTRQELRGQLGLEYCLRGLAERWGTPQGKFKLTLITDSKASIDIMENVPRIIGIKDTLKAEMDVGLEFSPTPKLLGTQTYSKSS